MNITRDTLNEMLQTPINEVSGYGFKESLPRITTVDGESLSVQAGELLYSNPRENRGPWYAVEVGFPSITPPESWKEYFDGDWEISGGTDSVYAYIPIELVVDFINEHGGINEKR